LPKNKTTNFLYMRKYIYNVYEVMIFFKSKR